MEIPAEGLEKLEFSANSVQDYRNRLAAPPARCGALNPYDICQKHLLKNILTEFYSAGTLPYLLD